MSGQAGSRSRAVQVELPLRRGWGGRRAGAGRKMQVPGRENVAHHVREQHKRAQPVHVVLRSRVRSLRSQFLFPTVRRALARANRAREDFRLLHFSVQADHLHLIVEAESQRALSRGMQGLAVRIARNVNRLIFRRGSLWTGRYYGRALARPRAFKNALSYVLNNFRKHGEVVCGELDPCSSSIYDLRRAAPERVPISPPKTWLGRAG